MCSTLIRAALLLVLFPAVPTKNDGPRGRFNCISTVSCKESVCVEVLTNFYDRFFAEEGQLIKYTPSISSLHLGSHFFHLLTPPRFGALNLPEVNHFTGNCFRMVRIVLKITFLELRYPKGVTGSVPLCPIMALNQSTSRKGPENAFRRLVSIVSPQSPSTQQDHCLTRTTNTFLLFFLVMSLQRNSVFSSSLPATHKT